jgi:hypothetical protein
MRRNLASNSFVRLKKLWHLPVVEQDVPAAAVVIVPQVNDTFLVLVAHVVGTEEAAPGADSEVASEALFGLCSS